MSSDEETPSFRARESARRSSGSRRTVVRRFDAIQAIYVRRTSWSRGGNRVTSQSWALASRRWVRRKRDGKIQVRAREPLHAQRLPRVLRQALIADCTRAAVVDL